jgi:hypothetical protein
MLQMLYQLLDRVEILLEEFDPASDVLDDAWPFPWVALVAGDLRLADVLQTQAQLLREGAMLRLFTAHPLG